jgi:transposase
MEYVTIVLIATWYYSPDFNPIEPQWANLKRALPDAIPHYKTINCAKVETN